MNQAKFYVFLFIPLHLAMRLTAHAQTTRATAPSYTSSLSEVKSAFENAAQKAHVAFIVEGEPYKKTLTAKEAESLEAAQNTVSPEDFAAQVALAYDYKVMGQTSPSVFVLHKRYTNPDDLPYVSLAEVRVVFNDIGRLYQGFLPPGITSASFPNANMFAFADSLYPEQIKALEDEKRGILVKDLSQTQRDQIFCIPLDMVIQGPYSTIRKLQAQTEGLLGPSASVGRAWSNEGVFKEGQAETRLRFGYVIPNPNSTSRYLRPLNIPAISLKGQETSELTPIATFFSDDNDPTNPNAAAATLPIEPRLSIPLREAVQQLQARAKNAKNPVAIDDEIANHPVFLINPKAAAPEDLVQSLPSVYGFVLTTKSDGSRRLSRGRFPKAKTIADIQLSLQALLPASFTRALNWRDPLETERRMREIDQRLMLMGVWISTPMTAKQTEALDAPQKKEAEALQKEWAELSKHKETLHSPEALRWAAIRFLRSRVEPRLHAGKPSVMPLRLLGEEEKAALADVLLTDLWLTKKAFFTAPLPVFITDFDNTIVTGHLANVPNASGADTSAKQRQSFGVTFHRKTADGTMTRGNSGGTAYRNKP